MLTCPTETPLHLFSEAKLSRRALEYREPSVLKASGEFQDPSARWIPTS